VIGLCAALVLTSEHSVLDFLQKTILPKYKDLAGARKLLFEFLHDYIKQLGKRVQEYVIPIKVRLTRSQPASADEPLTHPPSPEHMLFCLQKRPFKYSESRHI